MICGEMVKTGMRDKYDTLAAKYNVTSVPHFVFLKGGAPADAYVGASAEELQAKLAICFL